MSETNAGIKKKVLIADDDSTIRFMVKSILEAEGYEVIAAEDGKQAAELLSQPNLPNELAFVVLDVMMPGMTGLDVLTRIKLHSSTSFLTVIMLTGEAKDSDIMAGYEQGADYYITKPFTRQQLIFGINTALSGT